MPPNDDPPSTTNPWDLTSRDGSTPESRPLDEAMEGVQILMEQIAERFPMITTRSALEVPAEEGREEEGGSRRDSDARRRERRRDRDRRRRRERRPPPEPTVPVAQENATITVTLDDGTTVEREMTEAERFLHSHLNRVREDYIENNLEREIQTALETGNRRPDRQEREDPHMVEQRRKMVGNLVVLVCLLLFTFFLSMDDDDMSLGDGSMWNKKRTKLRGEKPLHWTDTVEGVSTYYRGFIGGDLDRHVYLELDSKGSNLPGLRLLTMEMRFDPPYEVTPSDPALRDSDSYAVRGWDFQGLHFVDENRVFMNGRGVRGGIYLPDENTLPEGTNSYDLYLRAVRNDPSVRSSYYHYLYENQVDAFPGVLSGSFKTDRRGDNGQRLNKECQIAVHGVFSRDWDDTIVSSPNFAHSTATGRGMTFPEENHGVNRRRPIDESFVANQLKWRRRLQEDAIVAEGDADSSMDDHDDVEVVNEPAKDLGPHRFDVRLFSPNCPSLDMIMVLEAVDMKKSSDLLTLVIGGFFASLAATVYGLQQFVNAGEQEENSAMLLKVEVPSLIMHVLLGGFEAGLLFSFGLESALFVPLLVLLALTHTFCTILLMVRCTVLCWRAQIGRRIEAMRSELDHAQLQEACRNEANAFVRLLTVACAAGLLLATRIFMEVPEVFALLYGTMWLPQIYGDLKKGTHRSVPMSIVIPVSITRAYLPFLIWAMPDLGTPLTPQTWWRTPFDGILLPLVPRAPSTLMACLVLGMIGAQVMILCLGHCLGPRWWVPFVLLPELHNFSQPPRLPATPKTSLLTGKQVKGKIMQQFAPGVVQGEALSTWFHIKSWIFGRPSRPDTPDTDGLEIAEQSGEARAIETRQLENGRSLDEDEESTVPNDHIYRQECVICMVDVEIPYSLCLPSHPSINSTHLVTEKCLRWLPLAIYQVVIKKINESNRIDAKSSSDGMNIEDVVPWALTPCEHLFHEECLKEWCEVKMECPTCRADIPNFIN